MVIGRNLKAKGIRKCSVDFYGESGINFSSNSTGDNGKTSIYLEISSKRSICKVGEEMVEICQENGRKYLLIRKNKK